MTKLNLDHVAAISHAEVYIRPAIKQGMSPHHRKGIEDDLERLAEIKKMLLKAMYEPGLPFTTEPVEEPKAHGDTHRNPDSGG